MAISSDVVPPIELSSAIAIDRLSSSSLNRLCQALDAQGVLPPAPGNLSTAGKINYLLDGLQHPKAYKLMQDTSNGPHIDIRVFTVNELKALARQLQAPFRSADRKQAMIDSIISNLTDIRLATAVRDRQHTEGNASGLVWTQTPAVPMPHRNRQPVRAVMRRLFGRTKQCQALADGSFTQQQIARLEQAQEVPQQSAQAQKAAPQADVECQRTTLEQQWELQEQQRAMQARQWACTVVAKFAADVQRLYTKGKGQTVPNTSIIQERLQSFPDRIQGYEALQDKPADIIMQGSSEFGCRNGFVVLLRGPEQYLTQGFGYIYIYYIKEAPTEFKVGVCKDLPERRVDSGRLVGRVVTQRRHNNKEYLLEESFPVPHRTLVDEVLKLRLKCWNYHHPDKGDGYTEWFRQIQINVLKNHIHDVIKVVTALYP
ncbi:TPA: hypothetical protein ACH3X1_002382 [Trebouxia sp. C0004]